MPAREWVMGDLARQDRDIADLYAQQELEQRRGFAFPQMLPTPDVPADRSAVSPHEAAALRVRNAVRPISGEGRTEDEARRASYSDPATGVLELGLTAVPISKPVRTGALAMGALLGTTSEAEANPLKKAIASRFYPHSEKLVTKAGQPIASSDPYSEYANWILKYNEQRPHLAGDVWHNFSGLRGNKPLEEMVHDISRPYTPPPANWDIADLQKQKASLVFGVADRTATGGTVNKVGDIELGRPVSREGGIAYPQYHSQTPIAGAPPQARRAFANAPGPATGLNNIAREVLEQGRTPYFTPLIMGKGAGDSSIPVADVALQVARQSEPTKKAVSYVNRRVREADKSFPGLMSDEADDWLRSTKGPARSALVQALDMKPARMGGIADIGEVRAAMTDPRLLRTPTGSGGRTMVKMAPELGTSAESLHSTYPRAFMAAQPQDIGGLQGSIPFHILARDTHRGLMGFDRPEKYAERGTDYFMRGMPAGVPQTQPVDQRMVDRVSEFFRKYPHGWSVAGAAPLAGLAAQDQYRQ